MAGYSSAVLLGNLTRDPEVRYSQGGTAIVSFGMAIGHMRKDRDGNWTEETGFFDVTMFGRRGEAFSKFHKKGSKAFIFGELRQDRWQDKNTGQSRSKVYVLGVGFEFVGSPPDKGGGSRSSGGGGQRSMYDQPAFDDNVPF